MFSALTAAPLLCANPIPHKVPKPYAAQAETMRKNQISAYPPSRFGASRSAQIRFFASEARSRTQSYAAQAETMRKNQISAYPPSRFGASRSAQIRFFRKRGAESYSAVRRTSRDDAEKPNKCLSSVTFRGEQKRSDSVFSQARRGVVLSRTPHKPRRCGKIEDECLSSSRAT